MLYHDRDRRMLQDIVTCIRHGVTINKLGRRREKFADRYAPSRWPTLASSADMSVSLWATR